MTTPAAQPTISAGDLVLDRYRVVEQIASGGHSVVYRGVDERLSRPVCIKVFSGLGGASGVGRTSYEHFVQEAFALSRLTHPNTLRIYDFGHLGSKDATGMPLQVCEYMNGGTLADVVRAEGTVPVTETVQIINAMCAALSEAHALGIVHRDIKPQNILFGTVAGGRLPKLADFGIAKWSSEAAPAATAALATAERERERRADDTQIVAGQKLAMYSPSWAAPEQLSGQGVTAATDIYSLAVVAVYMLSAKAIFADEDVYAGYKKRRHSDELLRDSLRDLPISERVIDALGRALAFDPNRRLHKVDELASELSAALVADRAPAPVSVPPPMPPPPPPMPMPMPMPPPMPVAEAPRHDPQPYAASPPQPPAPPYYAPSQVTTQPWLFTAPSPSGPPHAVIPSEAALQIGDRRVSFIMNASGIADIVGPQHSKLRITLLPGPEGRVIHVKGLSCFIAMYGGRPSPAVQLTRGGDISLVTPRAQDLGFGRVASGAPTSSGDTLFAVGGELIALTGEDCADPILFDFGPGSDSYFVYTRGRAPAKASRRG